MPTFNIFVTTPRSEIPDGFIQKASRLIAKMLGKPELYVTVRLVPDQIMCHGGTTEPCGSLQLYSIGGFGVEENKKHSEVIANFMEHELKIPKDRFYVTFIDIARSHCGYNGKTFA